MWYLVVPAIDPVLRHLETQRHFAIAHIMWGAGVGGLLAAARKEPGAAGEDGLGLTEGTEGRSHMSKPSAGEREDL